MRRGGGALVLILLASAAASAAPSDNVIARVRGTVTYGPANAVPERPLVGRLGVADDTRLATAFHAAASVTLPDSTLVEIGDNSDVSVGAFAGGAARAQHVMLTRGAIRFTTHRPRGGVANYLFATPTTQVAVRGTRAYLVAGPAGMQLYCVECAPGDVTVSVDGASFSPQSGQTVDVRRVGRVQNAALVRNETINNPAIDQFLDGRSPFGEPASTGIDPTGSSSGSP